MSLLPTWGTKLVRKVILKPTQPTTKSFGGIRLPNTILILGLKQKQKTQKKK